MKPVTAPNPLSCLSSSLLLAHALNPVGLVSGTEKVGRNSPSSRDAFLGCESAAFCLLNCSRWHQACSQVEPVEVQRQ